MAKIMQMKQV